MRNRLLKWTRETGISAAVAFALFVALEIVLRVFAPQTPASERVGGSGPAVVDSLLGHRYTPNIRIRHRTSEFEVEYGINHLGMRDCHTPADSLGTGARILVMGDSFAFGDGSSCADLWTVVMERTLRADGHDVTVVNAGVQGYDTRSESIYLEQLVPGVRADIVLLALLPNDIVTNRPTDVLPQSRDVHARPPAWRSLHTVALAKRILLSNDGAYARLYLRTSRKRLYTVPLDDEANRQFELTHELLAKMAGVCEAAGTQFAVVSIPQLFQVVVAGRDFSFPGVDPWQVDKELASSSVHQLPMLEPLADHYRAGSRHLYHRVDGHLTAEGNRIVAERVAAWLAPQVRALRHSSE